MADANDYLWFRHVVGSDKSTQASFVATGATGVTLLSARNALTQLNIQRVRLQGTTFATGSLTFTETDATGTSGGLLVQLAGSPASSTSFGTDQQIGMIDFGPVGWKLAAGKNLFMTRSATGSAGVLWIEAYETVVTGPLAIATTN